MSAPSDAPPHEERVAERLTGVRSVLSMPWAYRLSQSLIGAAAFRRRLVEDILQVGPGERVLDIGCGTADILDDLMTVAELDYVGFDHSQKYIDNARARFGSRGRFVIGSTASFDTEEVGVPDRTLAIMVGVVHHLDDDQVRAALNVARVALLPGGRFVSIDPTFTEGQHPLAKFLASHDRGQHVRTPEEVRELVSSVFSETATTVRHDLLRVPYTHVITRATVPAVQTD